MLRSTKSENTHWILIQFIGNIFINVYQARTEQVNYATIVLFMHLLIIIALYDYIIMKNEIKKHHNILSP